MSEDFFAADDDATPLSEEEKLGLKPSAISLRRELNEAEANNIERAMLWLRRRSRGEVLNAMFLRRLHKEMFGEVWKWAGIYSKERNRRLGVDFHLIPIELQKLIDETTAWTQFKSYAADEIAIRFHHRLVLIHPFPNGNGRHARLAADRLARQLGRPAFSWGRQTLTKSGAARSAYIHALRAADAHDIAPLLKFARA